MLIIQKTKPLKVSTVLTCAPSTGPKIDLTPLSIGRAKINQLYNQGMAGDAKAVKALVGLAAYAAESVYDFWRLNDPALAPAKAAKKQRRRREMLKRAASERDDFPLLHSWRKNRNHHNKAMLAELRLAEKSIWKTSDISQDKTGAGMHYLLLDVIYPHFQWLRRQTDRRTGLEGKIQALPPLRLATRKKWAAVSTDYCASDLFAGMTVLRDRGTWINRLAKPERQLAKRKAKATKRLKRKYSGELDALQETRKQLWQNRIDQMQFTDADLLTGLTEAISARLKNILKK
jgi:hypothetical protein